MKTRLRELREKLGLTQEAMADRTGFSVSQISRWERGGSNIPSERLPELARAYECSVGEVFEEVSVPVVGFVGAGGEIVFEDAYGLGGSLYDIEPLPGIGGNLIGLEVRGDSMWPVFRSGHVVFIRRDGWDHVEESALSDWAVCRLDDGRTLLKEVRLSRQPGLFDLISLNAPPIEGVTLQWATPIVGHRRRR